MQKAQLPDMDLKDYFLFLPVPALNERSGYTSPASSQGQAPGCVILATKSRMAFLLSF